MGSRRMPQIGKSQGGGKEAKSPYVCECCITHVRILGILPLHMRDTSGAGNVALCICVSKYMRVEYG